MVFKLHVLSNPPKNEIHNLDIIAVHGLNGHYLNTWTYKPGSQAETMWLKDLLPEKLPGCRVLSFEYDASIESMSTATVRDIARELFQLLKAQREGNAYKNIPIVFIGHSLGGIVIKQSLALARQSQFDYPAMTENTKGIVFFGTPHGGADAAHFALTAVKIAGAVLPLSARRHLELLKRNSEGLFKISDAFRHLASRYVIVSFYEEHAYNRLWGKVIVDKYSAIMGLKHEDFMMLSGTHTSMCRFSREDDQFDLVWRRIQRASEGRTPERGLMN
ncbi:Alpha/Beta hydrolase protein [Nemania sp. NC0429]|nr:Alpha/Beta hydrolase protein [Nemania sp. NC0429]